MDYQKKYLAYKGKYLSLKKQLKGGTRIVTVPNNGTGGEPGLYNQCMWISIRDYLNYHRGIITTVRELKRSVGMGPDTDVIEFNDNNEQHLEALQSLAFNLKISIYFIKSERDGTLPHYSLGPDGRMRPTAGIHPWTWDGVYIASFGHHFELIINGPLNYQLEHHPNSTIYRGTVYQPKIKINNVYVDILDVSQTSKASDYEEQHKIQASIKLVETIERIDYLKNKIIEANNTIGDNRETIINIQSLDLDIEQILKLASEYQAIIAENKRVIENLNSIIQKLEQDKSTYEAIIN